MLFFFLTCRGKHNKSLPQAFLHLEKPQIPCTLRKILWKIQKRPKKCKIHRRAVHICAALQAAISFYRDFSKKSYLKFELKEENYLFLRKFKKKDRYQSYICKNMQSHSNTHIFSKQKQLNKISRPPKCLKEISYVCKSSQKR